MRYKWVVPAFVLLVGLAGPAAGVEVSGRLLGPGEVPVAGARVEVVPIPDGEERARLLAAGALTLPPVAATESDDQGRYRLAAPGPGLWGLLVRAEGFVPVVHDLVPLVEPTEVPEVTLLPDAGAAVRVVDPRGRGVTGARVRGRGAGGAVWQPARESGWSPVHPFVQTRQDGSARLPRAVGAPLPFSAWAPAWVETAGEVAADGTGETVVALRDGVERVVEALSPDGEPVAGAGVVVGGARGLQAGTTDQRGRLRLRLPPGEPVEVVLAAAGELRGRFRLTARAGGRPPEDGSEETPVLDLALSAQIPLQGTVVDALSGLPLADAVVWNREAPGQWVRSGDDGGFVLPEPPGEGVALDVAAAGYLPAVLRQRWTARDEPWSVALTPAVRLAGRVEDQGGGAIPGARVEVAPLAFQGGATPLQDAEVEVESGPDGGFRTADLPGGLSYEVRVTADGYAPEMQVVSPGRRDVADLRMVLAAGGTLTGRVLRATGDPAVGARVRVRPEAGADSDRRWRAERASITEVDAEGVFTVPNLVADLHVVRVDDPAAPSLERSGVEVAAGLVTDLGVLVLEPGGTLEGRVVDDAGEPVAGVRVEAWPWLTRNPEAKVATVSGEDGRFRLDGLEAREPLNVEARADDGRRALLNRVVPDPAEPLQVVLSPEVEVFGRVVDRNGNGVEGARVAVFTWTAEEGTGGGTLEDRVERSREEGVFRISGLPIGRVKVVASYGWRRAERELAEPLAPGDRRGPLELVLSDGTVLAGRVLRADDSPAVGARVIVSLEEDAVAEGRRAGDAPPWPSGPWDHHRTTVTGSSGTFRLTAVQPGPVKVECDLGRDGRARWQGEVEADGTWIELRAEPQLFVAGWVGDRTGRPLRALVSLEAVDGSVPPITRAGDVVFEPGHEPPYTRATRSDADGRFFIGDLPPGRFELSLSANGYRSHVTDEPLEVGPEPVEGLEIRLSRGVGVHGRVIGVEPDEVDDLELHAFGKGKGQGQRGRVGADGRYRVEGLSPGSWFLVAHMRRTGRYLRRDFEVRPGDEEIEIDLDLDRGLVVEGELRVGGVAPPEAQVRLRMVEGDAERMAAGYGVSVPLFADGSFRAEGLVPGRYELRLHRGALREGPPFLLHLDVASDRTVVEDFAVGSVEGRVVDAAGPPVHRARVFLLPLDGLPEGQGGATTFTGPDGGFEFPFVPPGRWRVEALLGDREGGASVVVSTGTSVVDVTLP